MQEKRLIKADPVYNGILIYMASNAYLNDTALDVLKMVAKWIEEAPTVDAAEVVRCKDCKHLNVLNKNEIYAHCPKTNMVFRPFDIDTREHFCSCGERKINVE